MYMEIEIFEIMVQSSVGSSYLGSVKVIVLKISQIAYQIGTQYIQICESCQPIFAHTDGNTEIPSIDPNIILINHTSGGSFMFKAPMFRSPLSSLGSGDWLAAIVKFIMSMMNCDCEGGVDFIQYRNERQMTKP